MNNIDFQRQIDIFNPDLIRGKRIDVIGYGATGSHVGEFLVKIGADNIHVWDNDVIKPHNFANQKFFMSDVGKKKVEGARNYLSAISGVEPIIHDQMVKGFENLGPIVFVLVDSIEDRKLIFETCLKHQPRVECMIETRIADTWGMIYMLNPICPEHIAEYEQCFRKPVEGIKGLCGSSAMIEMTVSMIANKAVSLLQEYLWSKGDWKLLDNVHTLFSYHADREMPYFVEPSQFPQ